LTSAIGQAAVVGIYRQSGEIPDQLNPVRPGFSVHKVKRVSVRQMLLDALGLIASFFISVVWAKPMGETQSRNKCLL
jgi:hypothetical protein